MTPPNLRLPWRYGLFLGATLCTVPLCLVLPWSYALMAGFDIAALAFLATLPPLFRQGPETIRARARDNDANRTLILLITSIEMLVLLALMFAEMHQKSAPTPAAIALILATLLLAWTFSNIVYALHYAYLFYSRSDDAEDAEKDRGGIAFPGRDAPDYWDFAYFSMTLGMTFQTSDVEITGRHVRRAVTGHCLAAFIFNLGILAFSINVLGGS